MFEDYKEAWSPVMGVEFEYLDSEVNPSMANIVSPTEVIVVSSFHIEVDGGGGDFHVVMPYSMVEPIRELLDAGVQSDKMETDVRWSSALREEIMDVPVNFRVNLLEKDIALRDLMELQPGISFRLICLNMQPCLLKNFRLIALKWDGPEINWQYRCQKN